MMEIGRPQHRICERNTEVPTILLEPLQPGGEPEVFIQWFGESNRVSLEGMQFRFPVPVSPKLPNWLDGPTTFMVAFIGPAKDWPKRDDKLSMVPLISCDDRDPDAIMLWVALDDSQLHERKGRSHRHTLDDFDEPCELCRSYSVPNCFCVPMDIKLADGNCGIISPQMYKHRFFRPETWTGLEKLQWLNNR